MLNDYRRTTTLTKRGMATRPRHRQKTHRSAYAQSANRDGRQPIVQRAHRNVGSGGRPQASTVGRTMHHANRITLVPGDPLPGRLTSSRGKQGAA
jgi:hypothetical protein